MLISKLRSNGIRPTALYCGNVSYNKAYLGDELVFWKYEDEPDEPDIPNCLYFKALENSTQIWFDEHSYYTNWREIPNDFYYNKNNTGWIKWNVDVKITLRANDKLYVKGTGTVLNDNFNNDDSTYLPRKWRRFNCNKTIECHGNIMSLINWSGLSDYCFWDLFYDMPITTPPTLPATILTKSCYYHMFSGCEYLTIAPELPATTLAAGCYNTMFMYCTSLATMPVMSVKPTITEGERMFTETQIPYDSNYDRGLWE